MYSNKGSNIVTMDFVAGGVAHPSGLTTRVRLVSPLRLDELLYGASPVDGQGSRVPGSSLTVRTP
jgi:hypothetical protein